MYHLAGPLEVGTTRGVVAQTRAANALLVLLVALLACFVVLVDQLQVPHCKTFEFVLGQRVGEILVKVLVIGWPLELLHPHNRGSIRLLFDLGELLFDVDHHAAVVLLRFALHWTKPLFGRYLRLGKFDCHNWCVLILVFGIAVALHKFVHIKRVTTLLSHRLCDFESPVKRLSWRHFSHGHVGVAGRFHKSVIK